MGSQSRLAKRTQSEVNSHNIRPRNTSNKRSIRSTSALHSQVKAYQPQNNKARRAHEKTLARYPGVDQTPIPTCVIVDECTDGPIGDKMRTVLHAWREEVLLRRTAKSVGLREWEWSLGEPFDSGADSAVDDETESESCAQRRAAFTYTHGDVPIFRGRRIVLGRGQRRGLCYVPGDFSDLVSYEDEVYVPDREDLPNDQRARAFRQEITAGDFLTAPGQRVGACDGGRDREDSVYSVTSDDSSDEEGDTGPVATTC